MAKIFITGVAGFLGSHLADRMIAHGNTVVGIDNMIGGDLDNVPSSVEFHQTDCNDFASVRPLVRWYDDVLFRRVVVAGGGSDDRRGVGVVSPSEK